MAAATASRLMLFNKPFGVLSQFTDTNGRATLADYIQIPGFYAAGRLDRDSEGLMLLTNDGQLQQRITHPKFKLTKHYLAQVEGEITDSAITQLREGVMLRDGAARAIRIRRVDPPEALWPRDPPIRIRHHIPTSWVQLQLQEGRNRQVRRMTAAVGFPTLRLIRTQIGHHQVWPLCCGEWRYTFATRIRGA